MKQTKLDQAEVKAYLAFWNGSSSLLKVLRAAEGK